MDISDLKKKTVSELVDLAEGLNIQNTSGLRKQDLIFRIESSTGDVLVTKTTADVAEVEIAPQTGATLGVCYVALDELDTYELAGRYLWELEGTDNTGTVRLGHGAAYVRSDIILNATS